MSELRKTSSDEIYFVTLTVSGWVDLFTRAVYKDLIIKNLKFCQSHENLEISEYVIMTNHLHMLCRRSVAHLNELLGRFKSFTSKQLIKTIQENVKESRRDWLLYQFAQFAKTNNQYSNFHLWQYTNHPTLIYSPAVYSQKRNYIHQNPVKAGIVNNATNYLYSSACEDSPLIVDKA